jgi:hypothetical protein
MMFPDSDFYVRLPFYLVLELITASATLFGASA